VRGSWLVHAVVDGGDLLDPAAAVGVLEREHRFGRPVEVIGDEGYLLVQRIKGVA